MKRPLLFIAIFFLSFHAIAQNIYTFAGIPGAGTYSGDGGYATIADLNGPIGVATDAAGNVYIADSRNSAIRMVSTSGIITTFAGIPGSAGFSGDGGAATSAQLRTPSAVAVDASGNVYIADSRNDVIRMVNTSGIITTVAGTGMSAGYSGDGGAATSAQLNRPTGIAVSPSGNIYISDTRNNVIREVVSGTINTIAGSNIAGFSGDGAAATAAQINNPGGIAVDGSGNVYIADTRNNVVRLVTASTGIISTFAGNNAAGAGYTGNGGTATSAQLNNPYDVRLDASGNVYIADHNNAAVRIVNSALNINTYAGTGVTGYSGEGGLATAAQINGPEGLAIDGSGNVYISCNGNDIVMRVGTAVTGISITSNTGDTVCYSTLISFTATVIADDSTPHYQWLQNGVDAGTDAAVFTPATFATGDVISCILYTASGDSQAVSAGLRIDSMPNVGVIMGPSTFCVGSSANIRDFTGGGTGGPGGAGGGTWVTTDSLIVSVAGGGPGGGFGGGGEIAAALALGMDTIYYTSSNVCGADSASLIITVVPSTVGPISGPDTVCAGATANYTDTSATGIWKVTPPFGNIIDSLTGLFTAGNFPVTLPAVVSFGTPGCTSTYTVTVVALPVIGPITATTTIDMGTTQTFTATTGGTWSTDNGAIATVNSVTGVVYGVAVGTANIIYTVTNASGCSADTLIPVTVVNTESVVGITKSSSFNIYPNPATGNLNITWANQMADNGDVTIADVSGRTVYSSTIDMNQSTQAKLDISSLKAGVYMITIKSGSGYYYTKLVVGE